MKAEIKKLVAAGINALGPYIKGNIPAIRKILESLVLQARGEFPGQLVTPIPMVVHCPACGMKHVDKPEPEIGWTNPPHKSHSCHYCSNIFRTAPVPTVGVAELPRGKDDTWPPLPITKQEAEGYRVIIKVEKIRWKKKLGSGRSFVVEPEVSSEWSNHVLREVETIEQADNVIRNLVTVK